MHELYFGRVCSLQIDIICAVDECAGRYRRHVFTEEWLPDMAEQQVPVAAFPTLSMKGVWMATNAFQAFLAEELQRYE